MRTSLLCLLLGCGRYPQIDVDWTPSLGDLCGLDPAPIAVLPGPWVGAYPGEDLAVVDLDGDGAAEVIYSVHAETDWLTTGVRVHRGGPAGPEVAPWIDEWREGEGVGSKIRALGDVDGDGRADLAVAVSVQDASSEQEVSHTEVWSAIGGEPPSATAWSVDGGATLAALDANGDGSADLAVGDEGVIRLYLGGPGGLSAAAAAMEESDAHRFARDHLAGLGDVDGDDGDDLLVADDANRLYLASGGGLGGPAVEVADLGGRIEALAAGDFDGDGLGDWVAAWRTGNDGGKVGWWPGGTASADPSRSWVGAPGAQAWFARGAGDADGDGDDELVIGARGTPVDGAEYAGVVTVHPGGPDGPATDPSFAFAASGARCFFGEQLEIGDVTGDGWPDLVARVSGNVEGGEDAIVVFAGEEAWY